MKSKTPKKYPFTLRDISDLLDLKLGIFSDKFEDKLSNKFDEKLKILEARLSSKISLSATGIIAEMDKRFAQSNDRFNEMDTRFDNIDQRLEGIDDRLNAQSERVKRTEKHFFATA